MPNFYFSYLKAFRKYADSLLNQFTNFPQIGSYAILLTEMAKKLYSRAALNKKINLDQLIKDIIDIGSVYLKKFTDRFKKTENEKVNTKEEKDV